MSETARLASLLITLPSRGLGGAEAHSLALARHLAREGVAIWLAAEPPLLPELARRLNGAATLLPAPLAWREEESPAENLFRQAQATNTLVDRARPALVLLPLPWPSHGLGIQRALAASGQPSLVIAHLVPQDGARGPIQAAGGVTAGRARHVAVSAPAARRFAAAFDLPEDAVGVVPNGVPVPPEDAAARARARIAKREKLGLAPEAPLVVFAGRLEKVKGADLLPGIAANLAAAQGATVVALGEGGYGPMLKKQPETRPEGPLRLLGPVGDVGEWLLAADLLLLPSRLEGCPLVFLEAAARRCPVVASAAALECLGDAAAGMAMLAPLARTDALTEQVLASLANPEALRPRVAAAHRHATAFDEDAMLRCYAGLLRAAIA